MRVRRLLFFEAVVCLLAMLGSQRVLAESASEAAPRRLILGEKARVRIRLDAKLPAAASSRLVFGSNVGTVEQPSVDAQGGILVEYLPPTEMYPQVGLILVLDPVSGEVYQHRIDLAGRARLKVESEPHVKVSVAVGGRRYGPVVTDQRGRAEVPIVVRPGETEASTVATDSYDNARRSTMELAPPVFRRHLMLCLPQRHTAYVRAVQEDGTDAQELVLQTEAESIDVDPPERVAPGLFRIRFRPQLARDPLLPMRLTIRLQGSRPEESSCAAMLAAPQPERAAPPPSATSPKLGFEPAVRAGLVTNFGRVLAPWVSLRALFEKKLGGHRLLWGPELGYYETRRSLATAEAVPVEFTLRGVPLLAVARYARPVGPLELRAGVSLGAVALGLRSSLGEAARVSEFRVVPWLSAAASAGTPVGPGVLDLEAGFGWSKVDASELMGNAAGLRVTAGFSLPL